MRDIDCDWVGVLRGYDDWYDDWVFEGKDAAESCDKLNGVEVILEDWEREPMLF